MRRTILAGAVALLLAPSAAQAAAGVSITASPNPAAVGGRVAHTVTISTPGPLNVWVSARGFAKPGMGSLPSGSWVLECCPAQTNGTTAWHFRSTGIAVPGTYRFRATTRLAGRFLSTAALGLIAAGVWVRIT
jgi:hypothetical protein